mgnify:CR=1 FL=1
MKYFIALVLAVFFMASFVLPLYAGVEVSKRDAAGDTSYAERIRENNQKIATFIADTVKLPGVLVGDATGHKHEKSVEGTKYEGHEALQNLQEHIIRK